VILSPSSVVILPADGLALELGLIDWLALELGLIDWLALELGLSD
jgi:hypothetical protein